MARKLTIKRPDAKFYRGWVFVLVLGVALAVIALINRGGLSETPAVAESDGSTGCVMVVRVAEGVLNTREGPSTQTSTAGTLEDGTRVDATSIVQDSFRQLEDGRWASVEYLVADAGARC